MIESCDTAYIYEPLSSYRQQIFKHLAAYIPAETERLLDLGCGAVGFYWALGYLSRVQSITFADAHTETLELLAERIDRLSPESINAEFSETIDPLISEKLLPQTFFPELWLQDFYSRLEGLEKKDALSDVQDRNAYDVILGLELFDCANTSTELHKMLEYCLASLNQGGRLIGCVLNYREWSSVLEDLAAERLAGRLNPSAELLKATAGKVGFYPLYLETCITGMNKFPNAHLFCFQKSI